MASVYPLSTSVDLTAPSTPIGTVTPVAVTATGFTASPANNTSAYLASGASLTGANAQSLLNFSQTWNTTGAPSLIFANITDTASNAGSTLMDLRVNNISKVQLLKGGNSNSGGGGISFQSRFGAAGSVTSGFMQSSSSHSGVYFGYGASGGGFFFGGSDLDQFCGISTVNGGIGFGSGSITYSAVSPYNLVSSVDLTIRRDAANALAQRNGVNSQSSRLYKSFTDVSNFTRAAWQFDANGIALVAESAGTGDANIDVTLTPKGTGNVRYGTHSALAAEVITGFITIKDSSGTLRKLAVIS